MKNMPMASNVFNWVLPTPLLKPLVLGTDPVTVSYTIINNGSSDLLIRSVGLEGNDDPRVYISGGSCKAGQHVATQKFCSVDVTINPSALGMIQQTLYVQYSGLNSPLWVELEALVMLNKGQETQQSFLKNDTVEMENSRRIIEQNGHKQFGKVHAHERNISRTEAMMLDETNTMKQHPSFMDSQRFDGFEKNTNPNPVDNSKAQENFQEAQEEQDLSKQLRLGNELKFTNTPKFNPNPKPF